MALKYRATTAGTFSEVMLDSPLHRMECCVNKHAGNSGLQMNYGGVASCGFLIPENFFAGTATT
ncbi:hypothetical protein NSND_60046 [Nitrospira sp. ND1]|nr:hypothetical protein NSND_60046 [Nitrospira sp. ND1]